MNVNILGKGLIPGLKMLAPVRNVDLDQQQIARILKVKSLKVTLVDSPDMITKNNLAMMFAPKPASTEKVENVEEKTPAEELIEKAEDLGIEVTEEETETPVEEKVADIASFAVIIYQHTVEMYARYPYIKTAEILYRRLAPCRCYSKEHPLIYKAGDDLL